MAIFHSYVSLPEGKSIVNGASKPNLQLGMYPVRSGEGSENNQLPSTKHRDPTRTLGLDLYTFFFGGKINLRYSQVKSMGDLQDPIQWRYVSTIII